MDARAIALQGVGYGPQSIASQGFLTSSVVVEIPGHIGGGGSWAGSWFTRNPQPKRVVALQPQPRQAPWPSVVSLQESAPPTGTMRLIGLVRTTVAEAQVSSPSGRSRIMAVAPSTVHYHHAGTPLGRNDTTRIDEEFIAIFLANEDPLDDYT